MKKYLFLAEKPAVANLFKRIYEKHKDDFGFDATFIGLSASSWTRFDKFRNLDYIDTNWKTDVSKFKLPDIFYILGHDNVKNIAENINLNNYDEIISIVDPDIYGAILINEFANLKGTECSFFKAIKLFSLVDNDVYSALKNIKNAMNCEDFVADLVSNFKKELYVVDKPIFIFN